MTQHNRIAITAADLDRLQRLIEQQSEGRNAALAELLDQELGRAEICAEPPFGVVTMNSRVIFQDEDSGALREVTLCFPHEANIEDNRVSVLAPVGTALLGLSVGQLIDWPVPGGRRKLRIVAVPEQGQERRSA